MTRGSAAFALRPASAADLDFIRRGASEWRLNDERLDAADFIIAEARSGEPVGFGRIKRYASCFELGTVGVHPDWRSRGVGRMIVGALIERFPADEVWITTDLTRYFSRLGFEETDRGPAELLEKSSSTCRVKGRQGVRLMRLDRRRLLSPTGRAAPSAA